MYSWEITRILEKNNYCIDSETYINICLSSPQLIYVKFLPYEQCFEMQDKQNNYWKYKVYRKEFKI